MQILKKIFKITGWIIISIIILFIACALIIQISSVQNFLVHKATTFVSNKTNTKVEIERIGISFPKAVFIDGLYLEDLNHDTLIYAGELKVDIDMLALISSNIHINSVSLSKLSANISTTETDSLFNFNFLIEAFSGDSTKKDTVADIKAKKKSDLKIDKVNLDNIHLVFDDKYNGLFAGVDLKQLELKIDNLDLEKQEYHIKDLNADGLKGNLTINKISSDTTKKESKSLPKLIADNISLKNSNFIFKDNTSLQDVSALITDFALSDANVDLNTQKISLNQIVLSQSNLQVNLSADNKEQIKDTIQVAIESKSWQIEVKNIDLDKNHIVYNVVNLPVLKSGFDPSHLDYRELNLQAKNILYSKNETKATIQKLSLLDSKGFELRNFSVNFLMKPESITANNLKIQTGNSIIDASAKLQFSSLETMKDSIGNLFVSADLDKVYVNSKDILYFSPQLASQPFFKGGYKTISLSGKLSGPVKNLRGDKIVVKTGARTQIATNFVISGLPDARNAFYYFPDLQLSSGKSDISLLLGNDIVPNSIDLPQLINLKANFKGRIKEFVANFQLTSDFGNVTANAQIDKSENFKISAKTIKFNVGKLLKNTEMFGPVSLNLSADGRGLDKNTVNANVKLNATEIYLNKYLYHNLLVDGNVSGQQFEGDINLNDINAAFDFKGIANITPGNQLYKFSLDLKGADLKNLNFSKDDLRVGMMAQVDLKGSDLNDISGTAGITKIVLAKHGKKYVLDSLLVASINEKGKSELNINSALVAVKYNGTFAPAKIASEIQRHINYYFPLDFKDSTKNEGSQNFTFEIQLHNHPLISELLLPKLTEFEPGLITGSFESEKREMKIAVKMPNIVYDGIQVKDFSFFIDSDKDAFKYAVSSSDISNSSIELPNFLLNGFLKDKVATINISSTDSDDKKRLVVRGKLNKETENYKFILNTDSFYIANEQWKVAEDNYVAFGKSGVLIHNLSLEKEEENVLIASVNDKFNDDYSIHLKNFNLADVSNIIQKDTGFIQGKVNADITLKNSEASFGIIANATINDLAFRQIPVGTLKMKADNSSGGKYAIDAYLYGEGNDVSVSGSLSPEDTANALKFKAVINNLSLKTVEAFSMGQITDAAGNLKADFNINGSIAQPELNGSLTLTEAYMNPALLNNRLHFKNETIDIKADGVYFNDFNIEDQFGKEASINGFVKMNHFKDFNFGLAINSRDFTVFNTTQKNNKVYYGRMIIDSRINVKGTPELPVVTSRIRLKDGSNFTFAVPEKSLNTDKGEGVVLFVDSLKFHPIITRNEEIEKQKSSMKGFDLSSSIEVDEKATLRLMLDPSTSDSLVVRGNAALSFSLDPSGKISLTGAYNLSDGSYLVSLKSLVKRKFEIEKGSTIIWNGDPLDAEVNINAIYTIRTSPIDLVADQVSGLSEADQNMYRERLPFLVYLKLQGPLLKPEISFEIQLPQEQRGAMGGAVNAKLQLLNEDPSALNKQVFALLVLRRFIQENPLESSGNGGLSTTARNSVSSLLSAQLNRLGSNVVPGFELNFDVQSYDDYSSGQAEGRTEVGIGIEKQLFNERLSVQVGGTVDVEGQKAQQNNASDITGDVTLEYKLTEDGRYRLKGFRQNEYEGALEGQLTETGAGIRYTRNFDLWKEFFKSPKKKRDKKKIVVDTDAPETK